jgi:AraC-like DNA-binding protein
MRLDPVDKLPCDFDASAEVLSVGDVDIVELQCGPAEGSWARDAIVASGRLRVIQLAPVRDATASWHGRDVSLADGAAAILGPSDGRFRAPHGLRAIQVNVPRRAIPATNAEIDRINDPRLLRQDPVHAGLIRPTMLGLASHLGALSRSSVPELEDVWTSLITMLVRSLLGLDTNGRDVARARRLQAQQYIRANLGDPRLSPASVAAAIHVSRRTLYAAFPAEGGVAAEIRRQRLLRAHQLLLRPGRASSISEIAAQVGLPNAAHFSRIFRAHYGVPPSDVRARRRH